jgi:hypothetical protein
MTEDIRCELVTTRDQDGQDLDSSPNLVQWDENDPRDCQSRDDCLRYLADCGISVTRTPHPVVGHDDDPAISWGDLSDLAAPRDD